MDELVLEKKIPVIGICVGMQMMGNKSEEGRAEGLKWLDADLLHHLFLRSTRNDQRGTPVSKDCAPVH